MIPGAIILPKPAPKDSERLQAVLLQASPFLLLEEVREFLLLGPGGMPGALEQGTLRAVDISSTWPDGKPELRVYRYSVCYWLFSWKQPVAVLPLEPMIPHNRPCMRREEVASLLRCTPRHVGALTRERALWGPKLESIGAEQHERMASTFRAALLHFLKTREVRP